MSSWSPTSASCGTSCPGRARSGRAPGASDASLDPSQTPTHPGLGLARRITEGVKRRSRLRDGSRAAAAGVLRRASGCRSRTCRSTSTTRRPFLTRCAAALRTVPRGEVVTYGELAALAGAPGAARAAGSFCARSHLSIFVPCHRVVSAGGLGPYGSYGTGYKRRLLALEGYARSLTTSGRSSRRSAPTNECDRLAELSGLFHVAGRAHLRGRGSVDVHLDVSSSTVARRAFALLRACGVRSEIRTYPRRAFDRATRYQLHVEGSEDAYATLHQAGVLDRSHRPLGRPPNRVVARRCCAAAYLRGALLGSGTLSGPRGPHLEIRTAEADGARFLAGIAARLGGELHVQERSSHSTAYAKGTEAIADVLVAAGAVDLVLALEEQAVLAATRADANRLANADHANLVRTGRAAHAQLEALHRLDVDALPDDLREIALLRLRHPTASTAELARRCKPGLSKAAAYRRLRRLQELSQLVN